MSAEASPGEYANAATRLRLASFFLAALLFSTACYDQILAPADEANDRLAVTNNESTLDGRVSYVEDSVSIDTTGAARAPGGGAMAAPARAPRSVRLTLLAEVLPPTVGGERVQATSVSALRDKTAVVSYNFRGSPWHGALDFFIRLDSNRPKLTSSVVFADSDVNAVAADRSYAYAAVSSGDDSFETPAVLERIRLDGNNFRLDDDLRVPLTSFAATSAVLANDKVYATSGDGGGVFAFRASDLQPLGQYALDDARWVTWDEGGRIVVVQGTPGRMSIFAEGSFPGGSMQLLNTFPFAGADVPESKSTVVILGGKAFVAAGPEGVQVLCLATGEIIGSVPRPDPASLGLESSVVVTNAVAVDGDLIFISNGEAGVYVAAASEDLGNNDCGPLNISVLGRLRLDDLESVNHVEYRDQYLYIAAGIGGLKIIEVAN